MREGWTTKQLGDLCTIRPPKKEARAKLDDNAEVGFLPMEALGIRQQAVRTSQIKSLGEVYKGYTYFADGDVLLAKITPCFQNGKLGIARDLPNGVGFGSSEYFVLRSNGEILPEYLFYFLSQNSFIEGGVHQMSGAVGHQRVPPEYVMSQEIPLPPLAEQQRIVAILDEAFEAIKRREDAQDMRAKALETLETSWLESRLANVATAFTGTLEQLVEEGLLAPPLDGNHGAIHPKKADFTASGVPFIMASDLQDGSVNQTDCHFISWDQSRQLRKGFAKDGDVLLSHKGTIGRVAVLNTEYEYVVLTPQVTYYRSLDHDSLHPQFLAEYFRSRSFQAAMSGIAKQGSTRSYIGITKQRSLQVVLPHPADQRRIVEDNEEVRRKCQMLRTTGSTLATLSVDLRNALLIAAFNGELQACRVETIA